MPPITPTKAVIYTTSQDFQNHASRRPEDFTGQNTEVVVRGNRYLLSLVPPAAPGGTAMAAYYYDQRNHPQRLTTASASLFDQQTGTDIQTILATMERLAQRAAVQPAPTTATPLRVVSTHPTRPASAPSTAPVRILRPTTEPVPIPYRDTPSASLIGAWRAARNAVEGLPTTAPAPSTPATPVPTTAPPTPVAPLTVAPVDVRPKQRPYATRPRPAPLPTVPPGPAPVPSTPGQSTSFSVQMLATYTPGAGQPSMTQQDAIDILSEASSAVMPVFPIPGGGILRLSFHPHPDPTAHSGQAIPRFREGDRETPLSQSARGAAHSQGHTPQDQHRQDQQHHDQPHPTRQRRT